MNITISNEILARVPGAALGTLEYTAEVCESSPELLSALDEAMDELKRSFTLDTIAASPHIASTREAYRALGKSPHEYRNAAEAMRRRIVKGSGLYRINSVVEVNNLISVSSGYSIGSYDVSRLTGDIELRSAPEGAHYAGIGKESVNIGCLPVLYDGEGPFGNPSSDSTRAMIRPGRLGVISVVYSFDGAEGLRQWLPEYESCLRKYCGAAEIKTNIVQKM